MQENKGKAGRIVIILVVLAVFTIIASLIWVLRPEEQTWQVTEGPRLAVETQTITPRPYTVNLLSYGTVQPRIRTLLIAQVNGLVMSINPNLRSGGFFEKGDVLISIDPRDYESNVEIAEATLMDAQQVLADAEARSEQARDDWKGLGKETEVPELVLRLPQLEAAKARVKASRAELRKAQLDLQRSNLVAPYAGRALSKAVDIGQVVSDGTQLAEIYATEAVEVRLPLRNRDLPYIDLPEKFRHTELSGKSTGKTILQSDLTGPASWEATLVRTEGAIDKTARQLHVIAEIQDPYGTARESQSPLKIGQYVTAQIPGTTLTDAIVIPIHSIYQGAYVYLVEDEILRRREVKVAWQNDADAVIGFGLEGGESLVLTPLGQVTSGVRVTVHTNDGKATQRIAAKTAGNWEGTRP
jgi:multidrug efflux system membrane fusion protein